MTSQRRTSRQSGPSRESDGRDEDGELRIEAEMPEAGEVELEVVVEDVALDQSRSPTSR